MLFFVSDHSDTKLLLVQIVHKKLLLLQVNTHSSKKASDMTSAKQSGATSHCAVLWPVLIEQFSQRIRQTDISYMFLSSLQYAESDLMCSRMRSRKTTPC